MDTLYLPPKTCSTIVRTFDAAALALGLTGPITRRNRPPRGHREARPDPHPEEQAIVAAAPELSDYVAGLKQRSRKAVTFALRQLLRMVREYPREPLLGAVREAGRYGLYDLDRLERMILRRVTREYFLLDEGPNDD